MNHSDRNKEELLRELEKAHARILEMEKQGEESKERIKMLFSTMPEGFALHEIICDEEGNPTDFRFLEVNPAFERITNLKRSDVIGKTMHELEKGYDEQLLQIVGAVVLTGKPAYFEKSFNESVYEVFVYTPVPRQFAALFRDITDRKRAEEELQAAKRNYEGLFNNKNTGLVHCKVVLKELGEPVDFICLAINEAYEAATGLKREDVVGKKASEAMPFIERSLMEKLCRVALIGKEEKFEAFVPHLNRWYDLNVYSPEKGSFIALFSDITDQKRTEEALRESERNLSEGQRMASMGSWHWDLEKDQAVWSEELYRIYDFEPRPIAPKIQEFFDIIHPDDRALVVEDAGKLAKSGEPSSIDFRIFRRDGRMRWVHAENRGTAFDESGKPVRIGGTVQDVTEQKMAEKALKEAKEKAENEKQRMEAVMEALPVGVVIMDHRGGIVRSNSAFRKIWSGRYRGELPPVRSVSDYFLYQGWWPDSGRAVKPEEWPAIRAVQKGERIVGQMMEIRRFDGTNAFIMGNAAPITDASGNIIGAAIATEDITELRQMQDALRENEIRYRQLSKSLKKTVKAQVEQLREAEYLASLGRMVAIIAHEIRNPLLNIEIGMDLLRGKVRHDKESCEILNDVQEGVRLLNDTVNDLLEYARTVRVELELVPIGEIIGRALKTLSSELQNITVELELEDEKREFLMDTPKMVRALMNIITNAAEAMPEGGRLRITSSLSGPRRLLLSISDTGHGMDKDSLNRLFTPFYTTKITGTGLGLSISKKIIEAHEGKITVKSKLKVGTTVMITLPVRKK